MHEYIYIKRHSQWWGFWFVWPGQTRDSWQSVCNSEETAGAIGWHCSHWRLKVRSSWGWLSRYGMQLVTLGVGLQHVALELTTFNFVWMRTFGPFSLHTAKHGWNKKSYNYSATWLNYKNLQLYSIVMKNVPKSVSQPSSSWHNWGIY